VASSGTFFTETLATWDDWCRLFTSKEAFGPLSDAIYEREGLPPAPLESCTPGTNAVFKKGAYVVKIFIPNTGELRFTTDFGKELSALRRAEAAGVRTARPLAWGEMADKYTFPYMIMEWVPGPEAGMVFARLTPAGKARWVAEMKENLRRINTPARSDGGEFLRKQSRENERWKAFRPNVRREIRRRVESMDYSDMVYVHGDLTNDNVLVTPEGLCILDFADSCAAPAYYEYPPLLLSLFQADPEMFRLFAAGYPGGEGEVLEDLYSGILIHDFGGGILRDCYRQACGKEAYEQESLRGMLETVGGMLTQTS